MKTTTRSGTAFLLLILCAPAPASGQDPLPADPVEALRVLATRLDGEPMAAETARREIGRLAAWSSGGGRGMGRRRVASALLDLAARSDLAPEVRADCVRHTGLLVSDEEQVDRLAALLDDRVLAEAALFALERIDVPEAETRLVERLMAPGCVSQAAIVNGLGARRSATAVPALLVLARSGFARDPARAALARIGDPRAEAALRDAARDGIPGADEDLLVWLETRAAALRGESARVADGYRALLEASAPAARAGAIHGLAALGTTDAIEPIAWRLADPDPLVRETAESALVSLQDTDARVELLGLVLDPPSRLLEGLLKVGARTDPSLVREMILAEAADPGSSAHVAAVELLGDVAGEESQDLLVQALAGDVADARTAAAHGCLRRVARLREAGDPDAARELLHAAIPLASDPRLVRHALGELRELATQDSLAAIAPLAGRAEFRDPVARVRLSVAAAIKGGDPARAAAVYDTVLAGARSRDLRREAVAGLTALGRDLRGIAGRSGFVTGWRLLGPHERCDERTLGTHPFGETGPTFAEEITVAGRALKWESAATDELEGIVDLTGLRPKENVSVFAAAVVPWPRDEEVTLKIGSDDGVAVWVNGALVHKNAAARALQPDQDVCRARLRAGANLLLLRVSQGGGGWEFCVRIADAAGRPIDLTALNGH